MSTGRTVAMWSDSATGYVLRLFEQKKEYWTTYHEAAIQLEHVTAPDDNWAKLIVQARINDGAYGEDMRQMPLDKR